MGHSAKLTRRRTLTVAAALLVLLATGTYFLASSGTALLSVNLHGRPGAMAQGKLASYTPFGTAPLVYNPVWAAQESFSGDGNALGQVTTAEGHTPYVNFDWTNPETVVNPSTPYSFSFNPLGVCNPQGCAGWIDVGIYVPIYQGWCRTPSLDPYSTKDGWRVHDVVTIEDPALKYDYGYKTFRTGQTKTGVNDGIFCAELDRGAAGTGATTGVVPISEQRFSSALKPGQLTSTKTPTTAFVAPAFTSSVSSKSCRNATDPTTYPEFDWTIWWRKTWNSATPFPWTWCTPSRTNLTATSALSPDQNVFFLVATPEFDGSWTPRNWPHGLLHTLKFFVKVN